MKFFQLLSLGTDKMSLILFHNISSCYHYVLIKCLSLHSDYQFTLEHTAKFC